uniref:Uncharacterized protein n=1 Tax=Photinus pyralis TaxID=7054 RepID=A0A1Y1JT37_PHOPY
MSMLLTMEIFRTAILLLIFCFYTTFSHPSRPLNERSTELAWQAWLLVDDQNQNKHHDLDNFTRRRITPKSVFIAPTFSPESLPACAEGYRADSMGRCIRIIKLDQEAHLDFLLQKLNAQFSSYDDLEEDSQEEVPTPGPFQLNIPLNGAGIKDSDDDELDIAIVVAPTNGNFAIDDMLKNSAKRTSSSDGDSKLLENRPQNEQPFADSTPSIIEQRFSHTEKAQKTTTESAKVTTVLSSEMPTLSTININITPSTIDTTLSTIPPETTTLEMETDTTESSQHALFFLEHSLLKATHKRNDANATEAPTTTTTDLNQPPTITTTYRNAIRFPTESSHYIDYIKNPETITQANLLPHVNRHVSNFNDATTVPSTEQFQALFNEYISSRGDDLKGTERFVFKTQEDRTKHDRFNTAHHGYNHRNRDKHANLWSLPPSWSESSPKKPIVLRLPRRSHSRHLLDHHSQEFYREFPREEFSYIFGINPIQANERRGRR